MDDEPRDCGYSHEPNEETARALRDADAGKTRPAEFVDITDWAWWKVLLFTAWSAIRHPLTTTLLYRRRGQP